MRPVGPAPRKSSAALAADGVALQNDDCAPLGCFLAKAQRDWLTIAAQLPGKSLHLATVLQSLARAQNIERVLLSNLACQEFGIDRNAKYRALAWLESAGLIAVERKLGRSPLVIILDHGGAA